MKVTIDPAIEKDPSLRAQVNDANNYLDDLLDTISDRIEAVWTSVPGRPQAAALTMTSLDDVPAESTAVIREIEMADEDRRQGAVGSVMRQFLSRWSRGRQRRLKDMIAQLQD